MTALPMAVDRDDVREVMSREELQYPVSPFERFLEWLAERFDGEGSVEVGTGGTFTGGAGQVVAWLLIVAAVAVVVLVIVIAVRRRVRRRDDDGEDLELDEVEHRRSAGDWAGEAERWAAEGEWKLAVRARFRELVRRLVDSRAVADLAGRTTGELRADVAVTTPGAAAPFDRACELFELPWYADLPTGAERFAELTAVAGQVLDAEVLDPIDTAPSAVLGTVELVEPA